jgi:U3 small nucleolar RNA-associated protein 10
MADILSRFYSHLVDVLGPEDFLSPVAMLLADKIAVKVVRQTKEEAKQLLALPLALFHRSNAEVALKVS